MSDPAHEAFFFYTPREQTRLNHDGDLGTEPNTTQEDSQALLPLSAVPEALEYLGLDGDDDFVLSILHDVAEPLPSTTGSISGAGAGARRRGGQTSMGVRLEQWKEVVDVLLVEERAKAGHEQQVDQIHVQEDQDNQMSSFDDEDEATVIATGVQPRRRQPARAARARASLAVEEQSDGEGANMNWGDQQLGQLEAQQSDTESRRGTRRRVSSRRVDTEPASNSGSGTEKDSDSEPSQESDQETDYGDEGDDDEYEEDGGGFFTHKPARDGPPSKRRRIIASDTSSRSKGVRTGNRKGRGNGNGKLTEAHHQHALYVMRLFGDQLDNQAQEDQGRGKDQRRDQAVGSDHKNDDASVMADPPAGVSLRKDQIGAQDLVLLSKRMGDSLSLHEAEEMVHLAVRLGQEQGAPPIGDSTSRTASRISQKKEVDSSQPTTIGPFELAAVLRKIGMRRPD